MATHRVKHSKYKNTLATFLHLMHMKSSKVPKTIKMIKLVRIKESIGSIMPLAYEPTQSSSFPTSSSRQSRLSTNHAPLLKINWITLMSELAEWQSHARVWSVQRSCWLRLVRCLRLEQSVFLKSVLKVFVAFEQLYCSSLFLSDEDF